MAAVSNYAMQPHPAFYGDGSNSQLSSSQYYVASNQQFATQMYDKTKKTWSQRLKITKTEKISMPLSELPDFSPSALSRSMKYTEPWLYGTVRGIPARPVHGQAIFTPIPHEVAVVVCSCPEYLNGTKKEVKKASVCKKCKGSRLPLAPIGGTVRLRPTSAPVIHAPRASAGTVRLTSSSSIKTRPSILDPKNDPYDLMRRSRLVSPEPKSITVDKSLKLRAKSISPTRGRSRSRVPKVISEDIFLGSNANLSNANGTLKLRSTQRIKQERWLEAMENDPGGRRSILQCDVNPYDLISNNSKTNNEFAPEQEDIFRHIPKSSRSGRHVQAIAGQRISLGEAPNSNYYNRNLPMTTLIPRKNDSVNLEFRHSDPISKKFLANADTTTITRRMFPTRPPRRKHDTSSADEENEVPGASTKATNEQNLSTVHSSSTTRTTQPPTLLSISSSPLNNTRPLSESAITTPTTPTGPSPSRQGIKSILKRPSPVTSSMSSSSDIDAKNNDCRPDSMVTVAGADTGTVSGTSTSLATNVDSLANKSTSSIRASTTNVRTTERTTNSSSHYNSSSATNNRITSAGGTKNANTTGSQFYLPLPQIRKKVQFMVENRIIHHETEDDDGRNGVSGHGGGGSIKNENSSTSSNTLAMGKRKDQTIRRTSNDEQTFKDATSLKDEISSKTMVTKQNQQQQIFDSLQCEQHEQQQEEEQSTGVARNSRQNDRKTSLESRDNCVIIVNGSRRSHDDGFDDAVLGQNQIKNGPSDACRDLEETDRVRGHITLSNQFQKGASLRRTHSARTSSTTTVLLNFNDTMALRTKIGRPDSRDVFHSTIPRPKENPPLPPTQQQRQKQQQQISSQISSPVNLTFSSHSALSLPLNPVVADLKQPSATSITATSFDLELKSRQEQQRQQPPNPYHETSKQYPSSSRTKETTNSKERYKDIATDSNSQPARPPRQTNKKLSWQENDTIIVKNEQDNPLKMNGGLSDDKENNKMNGSEESDCSVNSSVIIRTLPAVSEDTNSIQRLSHPAVFAPAAAAAPPSAIKMTEKEKTLQAQNEILNGARLFGTATIIESNDSQNKDIGNVSVGLQKTVVRVAPFNRTTSEIHRLKIRHEDESSNWSNDASSNSSTTIAQKKTSILINGDNCYSTVNVGNDTPLYQSSVVVNNGVSTITTDTQKTSANTVVTINVSNPPTPDDDDIICKNNKINTLLSLNGGDNKTLSPTSDVESMSSPSSSSISGSDGDSISYGSLKRGSTLITLDFDTDKQTNGNDTTTTLSHEQELVKILRNPVEAVKRNLVPHVCGKLDSHDSGKNILAANGRIDPTIGPIRQDRFSFIDKLLEDPTLNQLAEGLENEVVVKLIENSLKRLKDSRASLDTSGTKDNDDMTKLIDLALQKVREERLKIETKKRNSDNNNSSNNKNNNRAEEHGGHLQHDPENDSNQGSISSGNSYGSANYDLFEFDNIESDCYQSCSSEMTNEDDTNSARSKFYQMLVDATLSEIELSTSNEDEHHYESIRLNCDPIYEEISDIPPPLPLSPPPVNDTAEPEKKATRSMFEGASKYDILSYLVDAKERGLVREEPYEYNFSNTSEIIVEEDHDTLADLQKSKTHDISSRISSHLSNPSDSSEDISLTSSIGDKLLTNQRRPTSSEVERNDSGVGSETSKSSRSKYQNPCGSVVNKNGLIHLCEDCDGSVETQIIDSGVMFAPLVCRKCSKKRSERKEIIIEIVETEEKYGRDLQIILEEFCKPMLVAGLLTQEQLSAIFLNTEELLENNQALAEKMRDALDIAMEQGDDDLLTVNVGKIFLESTQMLHGFESYCVRQAAASLLLANLEKDKELLRIFLRVSQMENTVLRRMNLNSFLMVPVQRVTKYPLLLARLYKVTPQHLEHRPLLKQAQEKIELHLNHMNEEAKDVPTKLWRRISSSSPNRRSSCEIDMINIKLRKMAIDILEWNHDEVRFAMEGKLLYTQPTDSNWKKARTIKLTHINALLVTNGKPSTNYKPEKANNDHQLNFPKHTGIREASLLMVKEKCGRYTLIREPLYLDRCIVCTEADWDDYFEVHEISSKDTFIFKAEDGTRTKQWYTQLQYHAQGMGAWRKRRNALANIMINGMLSRT